MIHSTSRVPLRFGLMIAPLLIGCGKLVIGEFDDGATTGASDDSQSTTSLGDTAGDGQEGAGSESASAGTSTAGETAPSDTEGNATEGTDSAGTTGGGASGSLCDPLLQDCPELENCVWAGDAFRCLEYLDSDANFGDVCDVPNGCDYAVQCMDPQSSDLETFGCSADDPGCCTPFCDLSDDITSSCGSGRTCTPWFAGGLAPPGLENVGICRSESGGSGDDTGGPTQCDGLLQDCPEGETCVLQGDFVCLPAGDELGNGPCAEVNDCGSGLVCAHPEVLPACEGAQGCCTPLCDLSSPACDIGLSCQAFPGGPFLGNESTGYCAL